MKITKKKLILGSIIIMFILFGGLIISYNLGKSNSLVIAESTPKKPVNNSFLTLMLEQSDGTYQESKSNTWPSGNYAFNSELSRCENGGELRWNREEGIVNLLSNKSDACYVYFDLYNVVTITNVSATKTTNSVTLTVTVDAGENPVATYYFSMDGGRSYETSTSPNYTFSELTPNTAYTFQVYAVDTEGYESNEETIEVTTDNYVNPVVNSVTTTNIENDSITVSVSATGGTNNIQTYYYSINNGAYASSSSNTYTFSELNPSTSYTIKVYVCDVNNVRSIEKSVTTLTSQDLIEFTIRGLNSTIYEYKAEPGMYWFDFIDSEYNVDNRVSANYMGLTFRDPSYPSYDNIFIFVGNYDMQVAEDIIIDGGAYYVDG